VASQHVAGRGLRSDLAAETMAHRRLVWPGACRRWLPVWLPNLVSAANVRRLGGANGSRRCREGDHARTPRPQANTPTTYRRAPTAQEVASIAADVPSTRESSPVRGARLDHCNDPHRDAWSKLAARSCRIAGAPRTHAYTQIGMPIGDWVQTESRDDR
jgi:hypothetical protein